MVEATAAHTIELTSTKFYTPTQGGHLHLVF